MAEYRLTDRLRLRAKYIRDHREPEDDSLLDEAAERIHTLERVAEAARAGRKIYGHNHNGDHGYSVPCADRSICYVARLDDALTDLDKATEEES